MSWLQRFADRVTTAEQAVSCIASGTRVFLSGNCSMPRQLLDALVARAPTLENVEVVHLLTFGCGSYVDPAMAGHIRVNSLFVGPNVRRAVHEGRADFTPAFLSEIPNLFVRGPLAVDVALVTLSPPDKHGYCSFGIDTGLVKTAAESARLILAELNPHMPRTSGDTTIHLSRLHRLVEVDTPLLELPQSGEPTEESRRIGASIAGLIPDGATLQLGIGEIPDAVLPHLADKRDLGLHTEMFSDGVIPLIEKGVINGAKKTLHRDKHVAGFFLGSRKLYDWVDQNPSVLMLPNEVVNDPFVIAQNARQVAINSALSVDLTGQVCADSMGTKIYSGVGGQVDFIYGASRSPGGVPIIALPSTAKDGQLSRIVPTLESGSGVVTSRNHVHFVVTEHGVADLYGRTIRERTRALIRIAAPQFREQLEAEAKKLHYI